MCEGWNIKGNEDKTRAIYISHWLRLPEAHVTVNGQNISFVSNVIFNGGII
jgi:hypothetical protein